jgi:hypothetical protein
MTFTASKCGHNLPQNIQFYYLEKKEKINRLRRKALRRGHCTVPPSTLEVCFTRWTQQKKEIDSPCLDTAAPCFEQQIQLLELPCLIFWASAGLLAKRLSSRRFLETNVAGLLAKLRSSRYGLVRLS